MKILQSNDFLFILLALYFINDFVNLRLRLILANCCEMKNSRSKSHRYVIGRRPTNSVKWILHFYRLETLDFSEIYHTKVLIKYIL